MSLAISIITAEGIVQAADSRVTIPSKVSDDTYAYNHFDNMTKLLTFDPPHNFISVTTYNAGTIGQRTAYSFVKEFQKTLPDRRINVKTFAQRLLDFYKEKWEQIPEGQNNQTLPMMFQVVGINPRQLFGELYTVVVPDGTVPIKIASEGEFQLYYGGDITIVNRLIQGHDEQVSSLIEADSSLTGQLPRLREILAEVSSTHGLPIQSYALQDAVDLVRFLIKTTADFQGLTLKPKTVGGMIEISCITKEDGCRIISKKEIK